MTVLRCSICRQPIMNEEASEYRSEPACGDCRLRERRREEARRTNGGRGRRPARLVIERVQQRRGVGNQGPGCVHSEDALPCTDCFLGGDL